MLDCMFDIPSGNTEKVIIDEEVVKGNKKPILSLKKVC